MNLCEIDIHKTFFNEPSRGIFYGLFFCFHSGGITIMSNKFVGTGNLGADPVLTSPVGDEQRQVADMRIYFDRPVRDHDSEQFEDRGGFWLDVSAWDRLANDVMRILKKGMRVKVEGSLKHTTWADEISGENRSKWVLYADEITLVLGRLESTQLRHSTKETSA
jgi:single-strand DNA-binding protein